MAGATRKTSAPLRLVEAFPEAEVEEAVRKQNATSFDRGSDPPDDPVRLKLDAKRINECLKHFNAFCNTLAAGILAAAAIIPFVKDADATLDANAGQWCVIALGFHILPYVLNFLVMRSEE